jgi:hypothetical protein
MDETEQLKLQLRNLAMALAEKEAETQHLKKELLRHRGNKDKRALYPEIENELEKTKEELLNARKISQIQRDKMTELDFEIRQKTEGIENLQEETDDQLRTIIGYQIDLETHNLNYTNYDEEQVTMEEEALDAVFNDEKTEEITALEKKHGCRTQQLISKLLADYADMKNRYKRDRMEFAKRLQRMEAEKKDLKASLNVLENRLAG